MRKILIIATLFLTLPFCLSSLTAQTDSLRNMKRWQLKGYAESALRLKDFYQAKAFFEEWHRREPNNDEVTLQLGRASYKVRDYALVENLFTDLYNKNPKRNLNALYYLSLVQMHYEKYEVAIEGFELLKRRFRRIDEPDVDRAVIEKLIEGCSMGIAHKDSITSVEVTHLNDPINTPHSESGFILTNDDEFIYSSVQPGSRSYHQLNAHYTPVRKFYKATKEDDRWIEAEDVSPPFFNSEEFDTGDGTFSLDRKRFYLTLCSMTPDGENICHVYVSHIESDGNWTEPIKLGKEVNHPSYTSTQPTVGSCFDNSLEVLYFVSDRPGGAGGMDIWFSVYNKRQKSYTQAANAGVFINTSGDEITPFYDSNSHRLYFSSDGIAGYGGLDIFYAEGEMVTWEEPVNVGLPINSSFDDLNFVRNYSGKFGLFTSNRPGSKSLYHQGCCDDVYSFNDSKTSKILVVGKLVRNSQLDLSENEFKSDTGVDSSDVMKSRMISVEVDRSSSLPIHLQSIETNEKGEFELWVEPGYDYTLSVEDSTLLDRSFTLSTREMDNTEPIELSTISLNSIPKEAIELENIYYEFDKNQLTSHARSILDSTLLKLMKLYPKIIVEVSAHTDAVGDEVYNQQLSEERAENVVKYLIDKGVSSSRLSFRGFGSSIPIAPNSNYDGTDNPDGRQKNRRTEFRITGYTD